MTDFEYDVKEKKRIASGAFHQKKGSKSHRCTLPHENLSPAQRRKLDGPVHTYALNRPMRWEEFKALPNDLKQSHIDYIQNHFGIGVSTVSKLIFGLSGSALRFHLDRCGLNYQRVAGTVNRAKQDAISRWMSQEKTEPAEEPGAQIEEAVETVEEGRMDEVPTEKRKAGLGELPRLLCGGEVRMHGLASELLPSLVSLIGGSDAYMSVHFRFTSGKEEKDIGRISEE